MSDLKIAHKHSSHNKEEILASDQVGCFYCLQVYKPEDIKEWVDSEGTAICPHCHVDAVIGDQSHFPITEETFLTRMYELWFK